MNTTSITTTASNATFTSCGNDLSSDGMFLPVLYGFVFCIGLPLSCLGIYGLYWLVKNENILPIFIMNLLLSDILQISMLPLWIDYYSQGHKWRFGKTSCIFTGTLFYVSMFASIGFLCCIALERYLAVSHPMWFQNSKRLKYTAMLCVGLWITFTFPALVYLNFTKDYSNSYLCFEDDYPDKRLAMFNLITTAMTFIPALLLLVVLYTATRRSITKAVSIPDNEKKRINLLLALVLLIFILVFGPYHIICYVKNVLVIFQEDVCHFESKIFIYLQIAKGLLSLNSLLDSILYIFVCKNVRKEMLESFQRIVSLIDHQETLQAHQTAV
ncbi:G-protein coupled receptor 4-like [Polyodon spathula]|uniref:G-protein coupled receptor 4-like n=1 Tax=Polyodon spathula TaxID=7913 RepID=UPI001B7F66E5|nr:G-protein coupled receptor 4-like [Polyodon spathula]